MILFILVGFIIDRIKAKRRVRVIPPPSKKYEYGASQYALQRACGVNPTGKYNDVF